MLVPVHPETPQARVIEQAVRALRAGGLVVYPTDTAYGLGCDVTNRRALDRLYQVKRREKKKPVSIICSSLADAAKYTRISNHDFRLLKRCLPGPYTFVLPAAHGVPRQLMPRRRAVGLRIPDHPVPAALVEALGNGLANSTVCFEGDPPLCDPYEIEGRFGHVVDIVLDAGLLPEGRQSTVVDLTDGPPVILRQGVGPRAPVVG